MSPLDLFAIRFLFASGGCLAAGLVAWTLTRQLRRFPAVQLQRSTWLLAQATVLAVFLIVLLPHSERLRIVPPIDIGSEYVSGTAPAAAPAMQAGTSGAAAAPLQTRAPVSLLATAALTWMGIYLLGLAWSAAGLLHARRLLSSLAATGERIGAGGLRAHGGAAIDTHLVVIEVDAPISPMLFGLFKPRLLLPRHLNSFDSLQRDMMIEHELTHLRRRDLHWMSAGLLLQTLLWFNPFVRLLRARLGWAQELGCDRDVLSGRNGVQRKAYAAALLAQLKMQHTGVHTALAFGGVSAGSVAARIGLIRAPLGSADGGWTRVAALAVLVAVFMGSLALQPALAWHSDPAAPSAAAGPDASFSCTIIADLASGQRLAREGQCDERVTPASTFNIAVSLMGYDSGILIDEHAPAWPFQEGYADWNAGWRATTDPSRWLDRSVVWYAQQVALRLGEDKFGRYVRQFGYGNQDVSGDFGKARGFPASWINSSLKISASEQVDFLARVLNNELGLSAKALAMTSRIMPSQALDNGWLVHGKTGTANPVLPDGMDDESRQYGWYVGWAEKDGRKVVFARLQLDRRQSDPGGLRARQAFLRELPQRLAGR